MNKDYITLDDTEYFDIIVTENGVVYKPKNYPEPIAIDTTFRKESDHDTTH